MTADPLTHLDSDGRPRMVDVGAKEPSRRLAIAEGVILMNPATLAAIEQGLTEKGNVLLIAEIAGIGGAKQTAQLIPLCHPLALSALSVKLEIDHDLPGVRALATAEATDRTGVEMEALTGVAVSLLTVYDMCKSMDRGMRIDSVRLLRKEGGRSGVWTAKETSS
jgi:cyclic pyranopterin monophosphate synthase